MYRTLIINLGSFDQVPTIKGKHFIVKGQPIIVFRSPENKVYCFEEQKIGKNTSVSNCILKDNYLYEEREDLRFDLFNGDGINNRFHLMKLNIWIEYGNILVQYTPLYIYDGNIIHN